MTWPPSTDEEPGPRRVKTTSKLAEEDIPLAEEVTKLNLDPINKEDLAAGTTPIGTENTATFASYKGTNRKNAGRGSRRTNFAGMPRDKHTGPEFTLWTKIQTQNPSTPLNNLRTDSRMTTKNMILTLPESQLTESINQEQQPFPSTTWVFSKELDDSPHPSS